MSTTSLATLPPLSTLPPQKNDVNYGLLIVFLIIGIIAIVLLFIGWSNTFYNLFYNPLLLNKYNKWFAVLDYTSIILIWGLSVYGLAKVF